MTQQRMTSFPIRKNLQKVEGEIRRLLADRGLQISSPDLVALIEYLSPSSSKAILSYALDIIRPFNAGLGLRFARLSDTQIEIVIPARSKNLLEHGQINESVMTAAASEAARALWYRHAPLGHLEIDVTEMVFKKHHSIKGTCRLRMELPEPAREKVLAQLRKQRHAESESEMSVFDEKDQKVAELTVKIGLKWTPALNSSKD
jgi:hypothetical protein